MRVLLLIFTAQLFCFSSCVSHKELVNFNQVQLPIGMSEEINNSLELSIQPNDLLRIQVQSIDPEAVLPFNQVGSSDNLGQVSPANLQLFQGYLVNDQGFIDLPILGTIEAKDMTLAALQEEIREKLKVYIKDPVVNARFLNFKVTVLGEVIQPGVLNLSNSRVTILEAIGFAGDLSDYANRSKILVVREIQGKRTYAYLDLQSDNIFNSPYYYLQQNDLVYVEPIRARTATVADPGQRLVAYGTALLSLAALVITLTRN